MTVDDRARGTRRNGARFWIVATTYGDHAEAEEVQQVIVDALIAAAEGHPRAGWNLDVDIIAVDEPPAGGIEVPDATESPLGES